MSDISNSLRQAEKSYSRVTEVTVTTTQIRLVKNDPKRLAVTLVNQGSNQIRFRNKSSLTALQGIRLASGATINLLSSEERAMVKSEINAIAEAGSNIIEIFEELLY